MSSWSDDAKNGMLGQVRGRFTQFSLHASEPDFQDPGASEISGGEYSRLSVGTGDLSSPSGGEFELTVDKEFSGPSEQNVPWVGVWDGSTFLGKGQITQGDSQFNSEGEFVLRSGTVFNLNLEAS